MTDVPFPLLTAPGLKPQTAGGRVLNCYPEKLPETAGKPYAWFRVPGLSAFGTTPSGRFRGGVLVNNTFYGVFGTSVYGWTSAGGAGTLLPGSVPGTEIVFAVRNNATNPDVVFVSPGNGAFWINGSGQVVAYPDGNVGQPNAVVFHKGFFIFTYGNGTTRTSNVNVTTINTLNVATAESRPDTLYRPVPLANGQLLLCGSSSMEVWGGQNDSGYPFSYIATVGRGIVGPAAIAGAEDGFGKGIFLVGDDFRVSRLDGYSCVPISNSDLDTVIERETNKAAIRVGVFNSRGHGFVVVQGAAWCWIFDTTLNTWHERLSYLKTYWRGLYPVQAFGKWLCGDSDAANLCEISAQVRKELGNPIMMRIETGPFGAFPNAVRINAIEMYLTKGASDATGRDPDETNAEIAISISRNGGQDWSNPRNVKIGRQAITHGRVRASIWGQAEVQGVRWRFEESAGVDFAFMGADMLGDKLR
ncbi:hypothetical protein JQ581_29940 [Bradyrhizobium liaoningense]|uniref:hypothetical protein n=1 Tax=Bradyrhizobium liaoningense TaxID=43992 RepID=UPI001BA9D969|nr:hypothetical protein [Bradyrhizobium liaoningense]MBR0741161.1 hypothetical protein [Bradyrhizobium liaoningense]